MIIQVNGWLKISENQYEVVDRKSRYISFPIDSRLSLITGFSFRMCNTKKMKISLLLFLTLIATHTHGSTNPTLCWPLGDQTAAREVVQNDYINYPNTTIYVASGYPGLNYKSLSLDGLNDYISLRFPGNINYQILTFMFYVYPEGVTGTLLHFKSDSPKKGKISEIWVSLDNRKIYIKIIAERKYLIFSAAAHSLILNRWNFVAVEGDFTVGGKLKIFNKTDLTTEARRIISGQDSGEDGGGHGSGHDGSDKSKENHSKNKGKKGKKSHKKSEKSSEKSTNNQKKSHKNRNKRDASKQKGHKTQNSREKHSSQNSSAKKHNSKGNKKHGKKNSNENGTEEDRENAKGNNKKSKDSSEEKMIDYRLGNPGQIMLGRRLAGGDCLKGRFTCLTTFDVLYDPVMSSDSLCKHPELWAGNDIPPASVTVIDNKITETTTSKISDNTEVTTIKTTETNGGLQQESSSGASITTTLDGEVHSGDTQPSGFSDKTTTDNNGVSHTERFSATDITTTERKLGTQNTQSSTVSDITTTERELETQSTQSSTVSDIITTERELETQSTQSTQSSTVPDLTTIERQLETQSTQSSTVSDITTTERELETQSTQSSTVSDITTTERELETQNTQSSTLSGIRKTETEQETQSTQSSTGSDITTTERELETQSTQSSAVSDITTTERELETQSTQSSAVSDITTVTDKTTEKTQWTPTEHVQTSAVSDISTVTDITTTETKMTTSTVNAQYTSLASTTTTESEILSNSSQYPDLSNKQNKVIKIWCLTNYSHVYELNATDPVYFSHCPRFSSGHPHLRGQATLFDGFQLSFIKMRVNIVDLLSDFTLAFFFRPASLSMGTVLDYLYSGAKGVRWKIKLTVNVSNVDLTMWNSSVICDRIRVLNMLIPNMWHYIAIHSSSTDQAFSLTVNNETFQGNQRCSAPYDVTGAGDLYVGNSVELDDGFRGSLMCLVLFRGKSSDGEKSLSKTCNYTTNPPETISKSCKMSSAVSSTYFKLTHKDGSPNLQSGRPLETRPSSSLVHCSRACADTLYCRSFSLTGKTLCRMFDFVVRGNAITPTTDTNYYVLTEISETD